MISHIVSVLDRPHFLNAALAALVVQDGGGGEIIVCVNGTEAETIAHCGDICTRYGATMRTTGLVGAKTCYESANMASTAATGEWLSFPSDDSLYVFEFSRVMLQTAELHKADLVYCDCVYRQDKTKGNWPAYTILDVSPRMGRIDKTCFIVRRSVFPGFPSHEHGWSDGALVEQMVRSGVRHAKAPGVLVVHQ